MKITVGSNAGSLAETFRDYLRLNQRNVDGLIMEQSRKLATDLYVVTDEMLTPSKEKIAAKVKSLGWRVIKRGTPDQWKSGSLAKRGRGRPSKAAQAARAAAMATAATLEQMQAFVIKKRSDARKYLASGWVGAIRDLGGSPKIGSGAIRTERGRADIDLTAGSPRITIVNDTPGIATMAAKVPFVQVAIARRLADMRVYIARKRAEMRRDVFGTARRALTRAA